MHAEQTPDWDMAAAYRELVAKCKDLKVDAESIHYNAGDCECAVCEALSDLIIALDRVVETIE